MAQLISLERISAASNKVDSRSRKIEEGTTLEFIIYREKTTKSEDGKKEWINDTVEYSDGNQDYKWTLAEFTKMKVETEQGKISLAAYLRNEASDTDASIPESFTIIAAENRQDQNKEDVYPIWRYNDFQLYMADRNDSSKKKEDKMTFTQLKESGLKEGAEPIQDYIIKINE